MKTKVHILSQLGFQELIVQLPGGSTLRCDPWVGCALPYDTDQQLVGRHALLDTDCLVSSLDSCLLPSEGEFVLLEADDQREEA